MWKKRFYLIAALSVDSILTSFGEELEEMKNKTKSDTKNMEKSFLMHNLFPSLVQFHKFFGEFLLVNQVEVDKN